MSRHEDATTDQPGRRSGGDAPLSTRSAVGLVARRELRQRLNRSFAISTVLTLTILAAVILLPRLIDLGPDSARVGVLDAAPGLTTDVAAQAEVAGAEVELVEVDDLAAGDRGLRDGSLDAVLDGTDVRVERELDGQLQAVLENAATTLTTRTLLTDAGLPPDALATALAQDQLRTVTLQGDDDARELRALVAFIGSIVLFGQLIGYSLWVAMGVVEEKASRVVEIIVAAIPTRALLTGKILGIGSLALGQLLVVAVVAAGLALGTGSLPFELSMLAPIGYALVGFVLGYAFYACVAAAAGSRISRQEDLQNVTTPITMMTTVSYLGSFLVFLNEGSTPVNVLSVIPPFSALMMPIRIARSDAATWEWLLALVLILGAVAVLVTVAARIYDNSVLRMGAKISWREAWGRSGG